MLLPTSQINENSIRCANGNTRDLASHVIPNSSRVNETWVKGSTHDLASYATSSSSRIDKNSTSYANGHTHDSASYVISNSSQLNERWIRTYWSAHPRSNFETDTS